MLNDIVDATYLPGGLSDHGPLAVTVRTHASRSGSMWTLRAHWVSHNEISEETTQVLRVFLGPTQGYSLLLWFGMPSRHSQGVIIFQQLRWLKHIKKIIQYYWKRRLRCHPTAMGLTYLSLILKCCKPPSGTSIYI